MNLTPFNKIKNYLFPCHFSNTVKYGVMQAIVNVILRLKN